MFETWLNKFEKIIKAQICVGIGPYEAVEMIWFFNKNRFL
jgi:hypothetical protein